MEKLNINNLDTLIWVLEFPENDETFAGAIKDVQELIQIEGFEHIYDTEKTVRETIDQSILFFNEMLEIGILKIPKNTKSLLEQIIPTVVGQPNNTAASKAVDIPISNKIMHIDDINSLGLDKDNNTDLIEQKHVNTIIPENLRNYEPPLNNMPENSATSRLTYAFGDYDNKIINDLELPKKKQYILQEIRQRFGNPVSKKALSVYGKNRFARSLERIYPEGYRISEIKSVITRITDYEEAVKTMRPLG